jgi:hypothetical protein
LPWIAPKGKPGIGKALASNLANPAVHSVRTRTKPVVFSHANEEAREVVLRQQLYSHRRNPASSTGSSQKKLTSPAKQSSSPRPATKKGSVTSRRDLNKSKPSWSTIDNVLSPFGLVSVDVGANDDCQFLVLAHLFGNVDHVEVRCRVVAELTEHRGRYFEFYESWKDEIGYDSFLHT